ncbi:MAG: iron dicitrate transport regulator FecR [Citrobacter freundii]|nr:MAG: iron dicitrate transport regulator FecR [Citrobacter freundii]
MAIKFTGGINESRLVSYLLEELPREQRREVDAWLDAHQDHQLYFDKLRAAWDKTSVEVDISRVDEEAEWLSFKDRIADRQVTKVVRFRWLKMAAAAMLIGVIAAVLVWQISDRPVVNTITAEAVIKNDTLPDGSVITLNKKSSLSYNALFGKDKRSVRLSGEAFFSVAHDAQKPFLINAGDVEVKVIGTSFNIRTTGESTEIVVETGLVQVKKAGGIVELSPGERLTSITGKPLMVKETVKDSLYNYYRSKRFECRGTPLWQLVEKLNDAFEANIIIENEELRNDQLTGTFNDTGLMDILKVVSNTLNIKVDQKGNEIVLYR